MIAAPTSKVAFGPTLVLNDARYAAIALMVPSAGQPGGLVINYVDRDREAKGVKHETFAPERFEMERTTSSRIKLS